MTDTQRPGPEPGENPSPVPEDGGGNGSHGPEGPWPDATLEDLIAGESAASVPPLQEDGDGEGIPGAGAGERTPLMRRFNRSEQVVVLWVALTLVLLWMRLPEAIGFPTQLLALPTFLAVLFSGEFALDGPNAFWTDLLFAVLGNFLYFATGLWYLYRRKIQLPIPAWPPVAYMLGLGLLTFPLEILAIFHLLSFGSVIGAIAMTWAMLYFLTKEEARTLPGQPNPADEKNPWEAPMPHRGVMEHFTWWAGLALIALTSFFTFYYALFYPITYTDALMYYAAYGKDTYLEGGFPIHVCGQVGIGLGANYPHLYPLAQATLSFLNRHYTDLYAQIMPPLAGLFSTWMIYFILKDRIQNRAAAMAGAVVFRSIPYGLTYSTWASDYPLAVLVTAVFFFAAQRFLRNRDKGYLELMMISVAIAPHINYLMWILYAPFIFYLFVKPGRMRELGARYLKSGLRERIFAFPPPWVAVFVVVALGLASPWYIRNVIVTGNPVYAFFHEFLGGANINPAVMASCFEEWLANGEGLARMNPSYIAAFLGILDLQPHRTFWGRWLLTPEYLLWQPIFMYKLAPVAVIFGIPGIVLVLRRGSLFGLGALFLVLLLWTYECYSGLYLYQVLIIIVPLAALMGIVFREVKSPRGRGVLLGLCLLMGLVPGLSHSILSAGKTRTDPKYVDRILTRSFPGALGRDFYPLVFGDEGLTFDYFHRQLPEARVLTHENRKMCFPDKVQLIHLDDCEVQDLYDRPLVEVVNGLLDLGIGYYLYVPNEDRHPVVARLGHGGRDAPTPYFQPVFRSGPVRLFRLTVPEAERMPVLLPGAG